MTTFKTSVAEIGADTELDLYRNGVMLARIRATDYPTRAAFMLAVEHVCAMVAYANVACALACTVAEVRACDEDTPSASTTPLPIIGETR